MTALPADAFRQLFTGSPHDDREDTTVGARAAWACEQLAAHLATLLGDNGVRALFDRSLVLASAELPWLVTARQGARTSVEAWAALRTVLDAQPPDQASDAAVLVLSRFVGLLERFIGEALVDRLLREVWPTIFAASKGNP
jgi:hypothetical protein